MFEKSAKYYDALYHFKNYDEASEKLQTLIQQNNPNAKSLLDVACGTGKHLEYLRKNYLVEGFDLNPDLLEIARVRCPGVSFHQGDMVNLELNNKFDVITCLFSSIAYVKTVENLFSSVARMALHLKPKGLLFIEPWVYPDNYWIGKITANFVDQQDIKIAWMYISEIEGKMTIFNIHYLVGTTESIECFTERHEMGLFTHEEYSAAFHRAGLDVKYDSKGLFGRGMYMGKK
ncbi:MAG: class I SAM-dependent methyltransferase [Deltaproteobacteria bacterium]|nr:class I SAM-dependent methyltransferase [Deltaproteobacteria bacterium]